MATGDGPYCFEHGFTRCGCVNAYDPENIGKDRGMSAEGKQGLSVLICIIARARVGHTEDCRCDVCYAYRKAKEIWQKEIR